MTPAHLGLALHHIQEAQKKQQNYSVRVQGGVVETGQEASPSSIVSLTSQRHPEKIPEVTGTSRGNTGRLERRAESLASPRDEA